MKGTLYVFLLSLAINLSYFEASWAQSRKIYGVKNSGSQKSFSGVSRKRGFRGGNSLIRRSLAVTNRRKLGRGSLGSNRLGSSSFGGPGNALKNNYFGNLWTSSKGDDKGSDRPSSAIQDDFSSEPRTKTSNHSGDHWGFEHF